MANTFTMIVPMVASAPTLPSYSSVVPTPLPPPAGSFIPIAPLPGVTGAGSYAI